MLLLETNNLQEAYVDTVYSDIAYDLYGDVVLSCFLICTLAETKIGRIVYSNRTPGGTVVIRILRFFVALCLLFLPSHRYRTKQNRSCQLLLNVRMQYGCFTQCQKRIKSLISFKVSVLFAKLYVKYKLISDVVK
jgi:hypothetical protein